MRMENMTEMLEKLILYICNWWNGNRIIPT